MTNTQQNLVRTYLAHYPHLSGLAHAALAGQTQAVKALGDAMSHLPYPTCVSGKDALEIAKIGLE